MRQLHVLGLLVSIVPQAMIGPPNVLPLSCAAILEWERGRANSGCQNRADLARRAAASGACACWATAYE